MAFVVIGVILLLMKLTDFGPVAAWSWWWILAPFGLALAWWQYADSTGLTRKREMEKDAERKAERQRRNIANLGLDNLRGRGKNRR